MRRVEVMGYVSRADLRHNLAAYEIDDGTGTLPVVMWLADNSGGGGGGAPIPRHTDPLKDNVRPKGGGFSCCE